ncbi:MAG TPA: GspE/PulE family protein [Candidatus Paceibacterota bacterium]|jgi:type IV pilus assembly protein PilB|nr:GspE/PulE family protein [Candidatus Paceibacterota bacterium]
MAISLQVLKPILLQSGLVSEDTFNKALETSKRTGQNVTDILISNGSITADYLTEIISNYLKIPQVRLRSKDIDYDILNIVPEDIARTRNVAIFGKDKEYLLVAMTDPTDLETIEFLQRYTNHPIKVYITTDDDLKSSFALYRQKIAENFKNIIEDNIKQAAKIAGISLEQAAVELPIVALFNNIVEYAASLNATDIHIERLNDAVLIRFRIDGLLKEIIRLPKETHPAIIAHIKILSNLQIDEHNKPQDGRFKYQRGEEVFDIRVSILPTMYGEKAAMRLLLGALKPLSFEELGMQPYSTEIINQNIKRSYGMILVTGPTGSGKTTTLYSILSKLNRPEVNVVTIEDPIEYEMKYINQIQVNEKSGLTFANGLRAIVRQDPNIIMVGEIRDGETADIAVNAALTGHLVLSTLHTNDATTAIPRLFDMKVEPFLVAATINAILAQRLVRRICKDCITSIPVDQNIKDLIKKYYLDSPYKKTKAIIPNQLYKGKGCKSCNFTGYKGRLAIYEILNINESIRTLIQSSRFNLDTLREAAGKTNMITMFEDGLIKAELGLTTIEEILRVIKE